MTLDIAIRHRHPDSGFSVDVAFVTDEPGVTALFGPSGAGKSTVINAVAGLLRPDAGHVRVNGDTLFDATTGVCLPPRRRRIGYVFQDGRLFPHLNVRGNLMYGWRRTGRRQERRATKVEITDLIDLLGLAPLLARRPQSLSGGERQRVAIGRALLAAPSLLLLDEPLAGLDVKRRDEILPYLASLRDHFHLPMLFVSHAVDEVARLADRIEVMEAGRIVASGAAWDVLSRLDLSPLTGQFDAGGIIHARISGHDTIHGLTTLAFEGGELLVPRLTGEPGRRVRARVRARDIMIARDTPGAVSANNVLPARITNIRAETDTCGGGGGNPDADVQLALGEARLVARITRLSLSRLGLAPGMEVYVVIKSVTID